MAAFLPWLPVIVLALGFAAVWGGIRATLKRLVDDVKDLDTKLDTKADAASVTALGVKVDALGSNQSTTTTTLEVTREKVERVETTVKELTGEHSTVRDVKPTEEQKRQWAAQAPQAPPPSPRGPHFRIPPPPLPKKKP